MTPERLVSISKSMAYELSGEQRCLQIKDLVTALAASEQRVAELEADLARTQESAEMTGKAGTTRDLRQSAEGPPSHLSKSEFRRLSVQAPEHIYTRLERAEAANAALAARVAEQQEAMTDLAASLKTSLEARVALTARVNTLEQSIELRGGWDNIDADILKASYASDNEATDKRGGWFVIDHALSRLPLAEAEATRYREALENLFALVVHEVDFRVFRNGVTDSTGTVDEGAVRASDIIEAARAALRLRAEEE